MKSTFLNKKRNFKFKLSLLDFDFFNSKEQKNLECDDSLIIKNHNISEIESYIWNNVETKIKMLKDFKTNKDFMIKTETISKKIIYNSDDINNKKNSLQNEKEYVFHNLKTRNFTLNQLIEITQINPYKKFNLILDLDLTMIKAVNINDNLNKRKPTDIEINGIANKKRFNLFYRYRPYLFEFSKELKKYFNFYISSLGHINYAKTILDDYKVETGIIIPSSRISCRTDETIESNKKFLNELIPLSDIEEINNTIIIDDNVSSWIKPEYMDKDKKDTMQCIKCLIPSKRYVMSFAQNNENNKYSLLIHNNIFENGFSKYSDYTYDIEYYFSIENDYIPNNSHGQLYYLELFIKKCMEFSLFSGIPIIETANFYRKKIFESCFFNLRFLDNKWNYTINLIIKELGGNISLSVKEATHFIVESRINPKDIVFKKDFQKFVNVKYMFNCYFNLYKFPEDDTEYNTIQ